MIPIAITHKRLISLRTVITMADRINGTPREEWEELLAEAQSVADRLAEIHVKDARINGNCEKCAPEAFRHAQELAAFDEQLDHS